MAAINFRVVDFSRLIHCCTLSLVFYLRHYIKLFVAIILMPQKNKKERTWKQIASQYIRKSFIVLFENLLTKVLWKRLRQQSRSRIYVVKMGFHRGIYVLRHCIVFDPLYGSYFIIISYMIPLYRQVLKLTYSVLLRDRNIHCEHHKSKIRFQLRNYMTKLTLLGILKLINVFVV